MISCPKWAYRDAAPTGQLLVSFPSFPACNLGKDSHIIFLWTRIRALRELRVRFPWDEVEVCLSQICRSA